MYSLQIKDGKEIPAKKMLTNVKIAHAKMVECVWICQETLCADVQWVGILPHFLSGYDSINASLSSNSSKAVPISSMRIVGVKVVPDRTSM